MVIFERSVPRRRATAAMLAAGLLVGLTACAPEPAEVAGMTEKGTETVNPESSWGEPSEEFDAEAKTAELPEGFPSELFALPANAVIDDAGSRGDNAWFVVLRAEDRASADAIWAEILASNSLDETELIETAEGGVAATLLGDALSVSAVTIPNADGTLLLSYDLARTAI